MSHVRDLSCTISIALGSESKVGWVEIASERTTCLFSCVGRLTSVHADSVCQTILSCPDVMIPIRPLGGMTVARALQTRSR
jgi:hypothetical protein